MSLYKKNLKTLFYILLVLFIYFILIDDLIPLKTIKEKNLNTYSISHIIENNESLNSSSDISLIFEKNFDFSKFLIFKDDKYYYGIFYVKGRISNLYNYRLDFKEEKSTLININNFNFNDNVFNYNFSLNFENSNIKISEINKSFKFDFSGIILIVLTLLASIFLKSKEAQILKSKQKKTI